MITVMEKKTMDGRKLKHDVFMDLRRRVVTLVQSGGIPEVGIRGMDFTRVCMYN